MRLEHFALQVPDSAAMAIWYVKHLGCTVARAGGPPGCALFLAQARLLIEIYQKRRHPDFPDYPSMHPFAIASGVSFRKLEGRPRPLAGGRRKIADDYFTNPAGTNC